MVAKISTGSNMFGAVAYNQNKVDSEEAKVLFSNRMLLGEDGNFSIGECMRSFEMQMPVQLSTKKPILHISINPHPEDVLTDQQLSDIAKEYMRKLGYGDQPYLVYKHTDIDRYHIHIVGLRVDENGKPVEIRFRERGESEKLIEEFMLLANQCAAHFARVKQIPFVYRVHEEPNGEKLERLHSLLQACGINDHFAKEVPTPKELSAILEGVRGTPFEQIVNTGMLRCMSKACYEEKPKGHYGLVLKDYAHFTSPIRRYPDLAIHRMMTDLLSGTDKETMIVRYTDFAEKASKQSSEREVLAVQIERKAEDYYKAEYARRHLGECYEGIISGVTQRGIFVELENGVEGFVPASSLTATGTTLTEGIRLSDPASGKTWSLGDSMMITIVRADINLGKVDFEVAPETK